MRKRSKFWRYIVFADLLIKVGALRPAERVLQKAIIAATDQGDRGRLADVYSVQAGLEERKGDKASAQMLLQKATKIAPSDEIGMHHCNLALFYKRHHEYESAETHFVEALRLLAAHYEDYRDSIEAELRECREKASAKK